MRLSRQLFLSVVIFPLQFDLNSILQRICPALVAYPESSLRLLLNPHCFLLSLELFGGSYGLSTSIELPLLALRSRNCFFFFLLRFCNWLAFLVCEAFFVVRYMNGSACGALVDPVSEQILLAFVGVYYLVFDLICYLHLALFAEIL